MLTSLVECSPVEQDRMRMTHVDAVLTCLHKTIRSSKNIGIGEKELWFASYMIPFDSGKGKNGDGPFWLTYNPNYAYDTTGPVPDYSELHKEGARLATKCKIFHLGTSSMDNRPVARMNFN